MGLTPSSSIIVVCRDPRREDLFDALLADPHDFDMIFVDSVARAYARIKELRPDLVVLFTDMNDRESFHLLSMLAIDRDTCDIPVVTYAASRDLNEFDSFIADIESRVSTALPARMN
jgi:response regulator of citrate/malate metabolism